ncbi:hypothetical protein Pa4123_81840 [Phytohabitans aurantiacus]|uniref:Uncharacterized protein n=1 Tax=Phytohabitans aurantiacus TaxID=3016789 RepID=A0ABQ5R8I8_9ACTN|nr:hypothetical protein Pa4123_81840 [Phytohabitans aurantiacus]
MLILLHVRTSRSLIGVGSGIGVGTMVAVEEQVAGLVASARRDGPYLVVALDGFTVRFLLGDDDPAPTDDAESEVAGATGLSRDGRRGSSNVDLSRYSVRHGYDGCERRARTRLDVTGAFARFDPRR